MVVGEPSIHNIMSGMESTGGVRLHNHKRKLKQRFDIIKKLGQGTYGKVQLGINKETGQEVAIKTIKKCKIETEADLIRIRREIQIMSSVQHPNIIHIYEVFENREKMVLVMEYAAGGELYDYLSERKVLSEEEARRIFRQISIAVFYCHKHKICHRDLKLENILLDHLGNAKIADFGLSNVFDEQRLLNTFCGSPLYASPEIVKGTPYHGPEVDCWSLGVLLYTLVYGAMPFDGSNFKRLTRQISASDYFEPTAPSPASPLIRDMLTKCPSRRADIERICSHWWVNEGYDQNCLDIAEDLAAQTPVRLDLLLSLVPQSASADKLVVTNDQSPETVRNTGTETLPPTRCLSVGSLMDLDRNNSDRIREMVEEEPTSRTNATNDTKRKLETTPSMEETVEAGVKKKERSRRKERSDDREPRSYRSTSRHHSAPITNAITEEAMEVEPAVELDLRDPAAAAACLELIREAQSKSPSKERSRTPVPSDEKVETRGEDIAQENFNDNTQGAKPIANKFDDVKDKVNSVEKQSVDQVKNETQVKKKSLKSKVNDVAQNVNDASKQDVPSKNIESKQKINSVQQINSTDDEKVITPTEEKVEVKSEVKKLKQKAQSLDEELPAVAPSKPTERRRSKIFETAEKFNQLLSGSEPEKPKKIFIPGVNVGGAKRAFERKASLSSVTVPQSVKPNASKIIIDVPNDKKNDKAEEKPTGVTKSESCSVKSEEERRRSEEKKRAVDIITGALGKPPVQKKLNGSPPVSPQSQESKNLGLKIQLGPNDLRNATVSVSTPIDTKYPDFEASPVKPTAVANSVPTTPESKSVDNSFADEPTMSSKMEIKLKSATLPRPRKTSKAEITLAGVKAPEPAFKSEVEAKIDAFHPQKLRTQKSEVAFPVAAVTPQTNRSSSLEPESNKSRVLGKERIIPIHVEPGHQIQNSSTPPSKPPMPQRSMSQRSGSLSRQSTADSDTDSALGSTVGPEPIRKSPREYIIPIAVEGGGYVTPRSGSVEPESKTSTPTSANPPRPRFGRGRRMGSLLSDASEDESPFSTLHRDSDDLLQRHMHRLRSSRPSRQAPEHADSLSSGEDDDDDGFELLTAENLFSTLLSRVRSLTQRLNVDDNRGTGFPRSRLLDRLGSNSSQGFWGMHEPLTRRLAESPFRRSLSRDADRFARKDSAMSSNPGTPNSLGARTTPSRESIFELGSSNTLPRDKPQHEVETEPRKMDQAQELQLPDSRPNSSASTTRDNFTPSLARRLSRQFIEQTRQSLPRSPSIPRDRLYRSSTEEPNSLSSLLPDRSMYRSKSSDRSLRRTNSLLDNDRAERPDFRYRRSVSLFEDDDDETLPPLPRQVMTLGRKYRDPVKASVNGIRRDNICLAEKIQEEPTDESTSPKKSTNQEQASASEGTSVCNSGTNLGDTTSSLSTKSETSPTESSSNIQQQGEALNSFRADAKEFESRLLAAENLIKESKLRNLGLNKFDPNLSTSYKDTDKCDKQLLGSMTDLSSTVLNKRRSCIPSLRLRSGSLTREAMTDRRSTLMSPEPVDICAATPERSLLSKLFRSSSISRDRDRDSESKDKSPKTKRRISRFLRPDFFDTPREESQYVKDKEAQKAAENERRKSRFMKRKENKDIVEEKPEKELKNEANELRRDQSGALLKDNKSDNDSSSIVDSVSTDKLERQNSKNSFLQSLEKKLEKLRSSDDSQKITNGDVSLKEVEPNNVAADCVSQPEVIKKVASAEDLTLSEPVPAAKSKVSSVLGLFKNDSKSAINGGRQQTLLSKFKKNVYRGSRSDTVLAPEASSKIPKAKADVKTADVKPRRSLEIKRSEKVGDKKSPPKEKAKEKSPADRASVERKSLEKQIKSPKKLSPEKTIDVTKVDKGSISVPQDKAEKEIRKSKSPDDKVDKNLSGSRLAKKISPEKIVDNKKVEAKSIEADEKKLKTKKSVKSLSSLAKNGSVSKLEKADDLDKKPADKVKKVVKKEVIEKEADGTKKKKIVRVVKKVVKKSDGTSDKSDEKEKDKEKKTLLKKITSSVKKESSPETGKKKEKSIESEATVKCDSTSNCLDNQSTASGIVLSVVKDPIEKDNDSVVERNDSVISFDTKISSNCLDTKVPSNDLDKKISSKVLESKIPTNDLDIQITGNDVDTKISVNDLDKKITTKDLDNKLRANRSNLKLDLSKIPQHTFKNGAGKKELGNKITELSDKSSDRCLKSQPIVMEKIIIEKPPRGADFIEARQSIPVSQPNEVVSKLDYSQPQDRKMSVRIEKPETEKTAKQSPQETQIIMNTSHHYPKITPDMTEDILSPMDDGESFDSWSICSNDMNHRSSLDLCSPTSPVYSPSVRSDHSESIIDRIRRKSFYSRFNERKRKSSLSVPPPGLSSSSTLPRKFSFREDRKNLSYTASPTRRHPERTHSLYNEDVPSLRKSPIERDRYSDGSYPSDLKSPTDHYGTSSSYYDPLRRYRISPTPDPSHRKYPSTDFGLDTDLYRSPLSPSSSTLNDLTDYRSNLPRKYTSVDPHPPKTADYYEELLTPSRIDYLTARKTPPVPAESIGRHENGHYNGHIDLTSCDSDKWRYSDKITSPDSAEDSDKSRGDDLKSNSLTIGESKELSAACPDAETTTSIVE
ncbi:uncharacterized protein LOC103577913 [Microplitis demolitor]|uniref:uncharacterized protein LOC103577913 n=1 Tax=Microplitis demolitor TaxID=69319 RepID=UPI0004CCDA0C|nr:uncharacterized protein LOC103577913 [Microplitis demolitor]